MPSSSTPLLEVTLIGICVNLLFVLGGWLVTLATNIIPQAN